MAGSTTPDAGRAWWWRMWALVGVFWAVALLRSRHVGIPVRDPHGAYLWGRLGLDIAVVVAFAVVVAAVSARRTGSPWRQTLRARWTRERIAYAASALLAYQLTYLAYHNLKSWDVLNAPRDELLLRWDRWLFFGHSPYLLLHDLLGVHTSMFVLTFLYEAFSTLLIVGVCAAVAVSPDIRRGHVFVVSGINVWILGVACYYLIPSLGPFWSAPEEFRGMAPTVVQRTQVLYLEQRAQWLGVWLVDPRGDFDGPRWLSPGRWRGWQQNPQSAGAYVHPSRLPASIRQSPQRLPVAADVEGGAARELD
jgi:hypothetical protein